jgi:hypothetical protein
VLYAFINRLKQIEMVNLYLIIGYNNVSAWNDNQLDEINLFQVFHETFENEKEKQIFIDALYLLDNNMHNMSGNYILLDEDEYKLLTT